MATTAFTSRDQLLGQQKRQISTSTTQTTTTTKKDDHEAEYSKILSSHLPERTRASLRHSGPFDTPPRHQPGSSLSGFQSPYTPPTQVQRPPPAPIYSTPQRDQESSQNAAASQKTMAGGSTGPETPKVGGKWIHPALPGIQKESRKLMFGEEELKRLVVNLLLLYSTWWFSYKIEDIDALEDILRSVRHSPRIGLVIQIISWSLRGLFLFNIITSILPLVRPRSRPLTDIPLTPIQRDLIGLDKSDITPIATSLNDTITPPRYKASPSGSRPSPHLPPSKTDSPRSVSLSTPSPPRRQFSGSGSTLATSHSPPVQQRPRSSSGLTGRIFASGVGGSPLGIGGGRQSGTGSFDSPSSRKASMEVFFRG